MSTGVFGGAVSVPKSTRTYCVNIGAIITSPLKSLVSGQPHLGFIESYGSSSNNAICSYLLKVGKQKHRDVKLLPKATQLENIQPEL